MDCGGELPAGLPLGLCSRCALAGALGLDDSKPAAASPGPLPFRFGDYEVLEEIARGGMGVVYKARQLSLDRFVAVKMLLLGAHASPEFLKRFRLEAETAAALQHPNIVAIHEVGVHDGEPFLVMDLIDGPNLAKVVKESPLAPRTATQYLTVIAEAIHYAHERGILHRDLKPSNVLIDAQGQPRVTDFGLAKRLQTHAEGAGGDSQLTLSGHFLGSPGYMPPEQAAGAHAKMSPRSDVYSLGAMLYHLLTGRPPFCGGSLVATLERVQYQEPVSPRLLRTDVPVDLETICLKCLEKDPQRRYPTARAFGEDLQRWLNHEPIRARPAGPFLRINRWTRRNPTGATLIAALLIGLAVSLSLLKMVVSNKHAATEAQLAATEAQIRMERARSAVLEIIGVNGFWDTNTRFVKIPWHILAIAAGAPAAAGKAGPVELHTLGLMAEEDPVAIVLGYSKLLAAAEATLNRHRTIPVRIEIILFKDNPDAIDGLVNHQVDLLKIGGNSLLKAKARDPHIRMLVSQNPAKRGVIFVRDSSDIRTVADLANRSMAFGDHYSTISTWAFYHVAQAGVTNLKVVILDSIAAFGSNPAMRGEQGELSSHRLTIPAVRTNGCDAGVSSDSAFFRASQGLRVILEFPSDPVWWVVGSEFPPGRHMELQSALVGIRDPALFHGISKRITHYLPADEKELEALREAMPLAAKYFGEDEEE
jgi:serine/threonine protein kinase